MKNLLVILYFFLACNDTLSPPERYIIDRTGIKSRTGCILENISISQYNLDHDNFKDIRPINRNEVTRYCCSLNENSKGSDEISFLKATSNYRWYLCKLNTNIVENDSLNNLPLQEKLEYIKRMELATISDKNYVHRDSFPFNIQQGYVYRVFGLCDIEGSYYFCLDSLNKLVIQYFDRGPL